MAYYLVGCYICMARMTRLTPGEVQQVFNSIMEDFGVFTAAFLCQSFLGKFLGKIIARRDRAPRYKNSIRQGITGKRLAMFNPRSKRRCHESPAYHGGLFQGQEVPPVLEWQTEPDFERNGAEARQKASSST